MTVDDRLTSTAELLPRRARGRRYALLRLARRVATESDPEAVMAVLLEEARRATGCRSGFVGRWHEEQQLLVEFIGLRDTTGVPRTLGLGEGAGGRAAQQRVPVIVNNYQALVQGAPRLAQGGAQAAVAAPLLHDGRLLGVVVCVSDDPEKRFTQDDADSLVMLGSVAAATLVELERSQTAQELRLVAEQLEQFIEATSDAIMVTGTRLRLLGWNRGAEQLYGWTRQEVLGRMLPNIPVEDQAQTARLWQTVLETGQAVANVQQVRMTRDGRRVATLATVSPMRDPAGGIVGVMEIAKDLTALKALEEHQQRLTRAEEREAIAMDLHDNTLQALHGAVLLLSALERQPDADVHDVRSAALQVREQLITAIEELRGRVLELRHGSVPRPGLVEGLRLLGQQVRANVRTDVQLDVDPDLERLVPSEHVEHLLAIASEAMFNAVRHARPTRVQLQLARSEQAVTLCVRDDGAGFDTARPNRPDAQGLANMLARARQIQGEFNIRSRPGQGTEVRVTLQFSADGES